MASLEEQRIAIHHLATVLMESLAEHQGYVPSWIKYIACETAIPLAIKYSPDQPRVPAGRPDGGQWTADSGGEEQDEGVISDPPLEPVLAPWEFLIPGVFAQTFFRLAITKIPGRSSYRIRNTTYSRHALDRMEQRRIPPSVVEEALKHGTSTPSYDNTTAYYDSKNDVTVIWSNQLKQVVMTRRGRP